MHPIEKRCQSRDTRAFVVASTVDLLADKMVGIIGERRMTKCHRYLDRAGSPRLCTGLRLWHGGFGDAVRRRPGQSVSVSLASHAHPFEGIYFSVDRDDVTEEQVAARYREPEKQWLGQRRNITYVELDGWPGEPGREDRIRIEYWNEHGVGQEVIVVFDDIDPVQEIGWDVKGDPLRRTYLWDEFCDTHGLHFEHPDHESTACKGRQSTKAEDLAVLAVLAERQSGGVS